LTQLLLLFYDLFKNAVGVGRLIKQDLGYSLASPVSMVIHGFTGPERILTKL